MTPSEFKYVLSLAHFKHFGEAAANCNVSQPALSIALKKFESGLGFDLLERSKSSVRDTAAERENYSTGAMRS